MKKAIIKEGDRFGRLVAIRFDHRNKWSSQYWLFRCDCGNEKVIFVSHIKNGSSKSCGCLGAEKRLKANTKHGMFGTAIYSCWDSMKQRCLNSNHKAYKNYGGRGITICPEWINSFQNFFADMGEMPEDKTLDRIDNNLGYCESNCRFSTSKEQANNRRNNHLLIHKGKTQTMSQWAEELGLNCNTIYKRLKLGWSIEKTLTFNLKQ